jgi:hypothetical protein
LPSPARRSESSASAFGSAAAQAGGGFSFPVTPPTHEEEAVHEARAERVFSTWASSHSRTVEEAGEGGDGEEEGASRRAGRAAACGWCWQLVGPRSLACFARAPLSALDRRCGRPALPLAPLPADSAHSSRLNSSSGGAVLPFGPAALPDGPPLRQASSGSTQQLNIWWEGPASSSAAAAAAEALRSDSKGGAGGGAASPGGASRRATGSSGDSAGVLAAIVARPPAAPPGGSSGGDGKALQQQKQQAAGGGGAAGAGAATRQDSSGGRGDHHQLHDACVRVEAPVSAPPPQPLSRGSSGAGAAAAAAAPSGGGAAPAAASGGGSGAARRPPAALARPLFTSEGEEETFVTPEASADDSVDGEGSVSGGGAARGAGGAGAIAEEEPEEGGAAGQLDGAPSAPSERGTDAGASDAPVPRYVVDEVCVGGSGRGRGPPGCLCGRQAPRPQESSRPATAGRRRCVARNTPRFAHSPPPPGRQPAV